MIDETLRDELMSMFIEHIGVLRRLMRRHRVPGLDTPKESEELNEICRRHGERLKQIVAERGWPGVSLVGEDGTHAASYILDHMDDDEAFLARCADLMQAVLFGGEIDPSAFATTLDRLLVARGQMQIFGTQHHLDEKTGERRRQPTADVAGIDDRRLAYSLPTLDQDEAQWRRFRKFRELQRRREAAERKERRAGTTVSE